MSVEGHAIRDATTKWRHIYRFLPRD